MYKLTCIAALLVLPSIASADRTIVTPSGYTMQSGFDAELFQTVQRQPKTLVLFDASAQNYQLETTYATRPDVSRLAFSIQAGVLPETFSTPAISIGIKDIGNTAGAIDGDGLWGRGFYLAASKDLDIDPRPQKISGVIFTGGIGAGSYHGLFGGVSADLPLHLAGTVEYDSRSLNFRVAYPIGSTARLSLNTLSGSTFVSFDLHTVVPSW